MKAVRMMILTVVLVLFGTGAYAADCNNGGRYEDMGDGTVTDCRTGMIWLKNAKCTDTSGGVVNPNGYLNWYDAMKWTKGLGYGFCGLSDESFPGDWRLPTKTEWMAMVGYAKSHGYSNPALTNGGGAGHWTSGDVFTNVQSSDYWSSTTDLNISSYARAIYMYTGATNLAGDKANVLFYVWPVRGGQSGTFDSLYIE